MSVDGLVERPQSWSWREIHALPGSTYFGDIHCVTTWSKFDTTFTGVSVDTLLEAAGPLPEAKFVMAHSTTGYTTNLPLEAFDDDDVLLATKWAGKPLSADHGGPVRAVVPKLYFWKSAKWVKRLEFVAEDRPGFWEVRGYHNEADPWKEERYD
jgi:DMSO/TMAO reductase YedYZ molybdopterin-dependent catalytic subunit